MTTQLYQAVSVTCNREMAAGFKQDILNYMTVYRNMEKDVHYYLNPLEDQPENLEITHPFTYMTSYVKDFKIPYMVLKIIQDDMDELERRILGTKRELVELLFYLGNTKKLSGDMKILMPSVKYMESLLEKPAKLDKLRESIYRNHPILYCSEAEYWRFINVRKESAELTEEYLRKIMGSMD